jgi:TrpR-related protein YerC/YecD
LTPAEIKEFANRLEAARLLSRDVQYNAISESTGLSSATIARIQKWLNGSLGGYRLILSRLAKTSSHHHTSPQLRKGLSLSA